MLPPPMMRLPLGLLALLPLGMASAQTPSKTETTAYTYTNDGSLLHVRTTVTEGHNQLAGDPTETYFTWDNCTPQAGNPPTCALQPANGNLLGYGPSPGDESAWSAHYDALDRLSQVTNGQGHTAVYHYHPDELLKASLNAEAPRTDGLQHYYDQSHYPQVTNLYDRHTETLSSRHRRIRYLEDGRQQLLVRHRKDVDGVYDPIGQTMQPYRYDPYGAGGEGSAPRASMDRGGPLYSVNTNPFQYSDELRDPVSGADYLRARWYLPGHQTFVQRDPVRNLNRYGYANGNPIRNHDPGGTSAKQFFKGLVSGFLQTPKSFVAMFGIEYHGRVWNWSPETAARFWGNPVTIASLLADAVMSPAASDVAADLDVWFAGGRWYGSDTSQAAIGVRGRLKVLGLKMLTTGFQHFGQTAAAVGFSRLNPHHRSESFARQYGAAVAGSVVTATAFAVVKSATEYMISTDRYWSQERGEFVTQRSRFRANASAISSREQTLASDIDRRALQDIAIRVRRHAFGQGDEVSPTHERFLEGVDKSRTYSYARRLESARGVRAQTLWYSILRAKRYFRSVPYGKPLPLPAVDAIDGFSFDSGSDSSSGSD